MPTPEVAEWADPVWHLYVVRTAAARRVREALAADAIASGMHYPVPLHLQPALAPLGHGGDFPAAEAWAARAFRCRSSPSWSRRARPCRRRRPGSRRVTTGPANEAPHRLIDDVDFGEGVVVQSFTNLYGCRIGDGTRIGPFVEVQRGAVVGARCKIQSHTFICDGVEIGDRVFVGHGVMFVNDKTPQATNPARRSPAEATGRCCRSTSGTARPSALVR